MSWLSTCSDFQCIVLNVYFQCCCTILFLLPCTVCTTTYSLWTWRPMTPQPITFSYSSEWLSQEWYFRFVHLRNKQQCKSSEGYELGLSCDQILWSLKVSKKICSSTNQVHVLLNLSRSLFMHIPLLSRIMNVNHVFLFFIMQHKLACTIIIVTS